MKNSRIIIIYLLLFNYNLVAQTDKEIYKNLIANNISFYDIKDSTVFIDLFLYNRFRNDTFTSKDVFYFKSKDKNNHQITFSSIYWLNYLNKNTYSYENKNRIFEEEKKVLDEVDFDKNLHNSTFYPLGEILSKNKGDFNKKTYGKYTISRVKDTFTLTQKYKKLNRTRKLYFKDDYKIFRLEEFNHNENDPDAYLRIDFHYFQNNCFDSLNKALQLGLYTPIPEKKLITPVKDTISKTSKVIHTFGYNDADTLLVIDTNKYYLFDYWYLSCRPCLDMMPFMKKLHEKIDGNKLVIIGANPSDKKENILNYLNKRDYHFLQLDKTKNMPFHNINSHPTLILMDGNFNEVKRFKGYAKGYTDYEITKFLKSIDLLK
jgi:thiol-disulfide isomerase/thioredoxin